MDRNIDFTRIFTLYQSAVTKLGVKTLAHELKKSDKTIYAEMSLENLSTYLEIIQNYDDLNGKPSYLPKLGLVDFLIGLFETRDLSPLKSINENFGLGTFNLPKSQMGRIDFLEALQRINKEYSEGIHETLCAIQDEKVSADEAKKCSKELMDAINELSNLKAYYDSIAINKK